MKLTIDRDVLAAALAAARGFVDRSHVVPIMKCILLSAEDGQLEILATDMVVGCGLTVEADVSSPGCVAIDAETFYGFINRIPSGSAIELALERSALIITSGRIKGSIDTPAPASLFPTVSPEEWPVRFKLDRCALARVMNLPAAAISSETARPVITGLHLSVVGGRLAGTSTNGKILIRSFVDLPAMHGNLAGTGGVIIPSKAIANMRSISSDEVMIGLSERSAQFHASNIVITTRLITGPYVNSDAVIFDQVESSIETNRDNLIRAIDRVLILTDADTKGVRVTCANSIATLSSVLLANKSAAEDMDAKLEGKPFEFGVNGKQIMALLGVCSGERVRIGRGYTKNGGEVLRVFDPDNSDVTMIIVPERI